MADNFSPSTSVMNDISKEKTTENVMHKEPLPCGSSLNNTNTSGQVPHQPRPTSTYNGESIQPFIDARSMPNPSAEKIKTHIVWSCLNILCCCWCVGCIACHYSLETERLRKNGDIQGALKNSERARSINVVGTMLGVIIIIIDVIYILYRIAKS
jgi:hypothetical protein